jgi:hypothetical protein
VLITLECPSFEQIKSKTSLSLEGVSSVSYWLPLRPRVCLIWIVLPMMIFSNPQAAVLEEELKDAPARAKIKKHPPSGLKGLMWRQSWLNHKRIQRCAPWC